MKDLMFKERSVKKLVDKYVGSYIINEVVFIYLFFISTIYYMECKGRLW